MAYVATDASIPIPIISIPLRTQLFLLKMALLAPTRNRQPMLAIAAVITAGFTSIKAKGRIGIRDTTANDRPVKRAALVGGHDSSEPSYYPEMVIFRSQNGWINNAYFLNGAL